MGRSEKTLVKGETTFKYTFSWLKKEITGLSVGGERDYKAHCKCEADYFIHVFMCLCVNFSDSPTVM